MANLEKHKKNIMQEWIEGEESTVPAQTRSAHVLGAYIKIPKAAVSRRSRPQKPNGVAARVEPALVREAAPPPKVEDKPTQASSPEHLRKQQRLSKLRAPFAPKPARGAARG